MTNSNSSIMSVGELIDYAFGEENVNVVNHKLLQTILYLFARQLRLLERRVEVQIGPSMRLTPSSSISVTEVKLHAMMKKKKRLGKPQVKEKESTMAAEKQPPHKPALATPGTTVAGITAAPDKTTPHKTSTEKSSEKGTTEAQKKAVITSKDYQSLLDKIEEQREKELRIIHKRGNSREEHNSLPTPMASLDSVEAQYEKLLIVERVPSDEARHKLGLRPDIPTPRLSIVTQEQFASLSTTVKALHEKFTTMGVPGFPENMELMHELRKGASLTDAMAALQLSARLEATEKTLERMLSLITELAKATPGIDLAAIETMINTQVLYGDKTVASKSTTRHSNIQEGGKPTAPRSHRELEIEVLPSELTQTTLSEALPQSEKSIHATSIETVKEKTDCISYDELDLAMRELYDNILNIVNGITTRSTVNSDKALKIATKLEREFDTSLNLGARMDDLEVSVAEYAEKINALDTELSSQMTNYQEQLTQIQHDLESGLENMAEMLATAGGDTTAVAELNGQFTNLQLDFDNMTIKQKDLKDLLDTLFLDLKALWKETELLRDTKSDRDEVADAFRDKAGIEALNGLVSLQQFNAVRGDFEKRIVSAYDKFNNQEMVWQKAIDDLLRELNEKADYIQVVSLRDEINKYLEILNDRIHAMLKIVGEPNAAAITKKIFRDTTCLSCATPARMNLEETTVIALPALRGSRPLVYGAEASKHKEGEGDQVLCFPGQVVPHPQDFRGHVCQRYCGGSHTMVNTTVNRVSPSMIINPLTRQVTTGLGIDGRPYKVDETQLKEPCAPCSIPKPSTPRSSKIEEVSEPREIPSDMTPPDYSSIGDLLISQHYIDVTPPPNFDED